MDRAVLVGASYQIHDKRQERFEWFDHNHSNRWSNIGIDERFCDWHLPKHPVF